MPMRACTPAAPRPTTAIVASDTGLTIEAKAAPSAETVPARPRPEPIAADSCVPCCRAIISGFMPIAAVTPMSWNCAAILAVFICTLKAVASSASSEACCCLTAATPELASPSSFIEMTKGAGIAKPLEPNCGKRRTGNRNQCAVRRCVPPAGQHP